MDIRLLSEKYRRLPPEDNPGSINERHGFIHAKFSSGAKEMSKPEFVKQVLSEIKEAFMAELFKWEESEDSNGT